MRLKDKKTDDKDEDSHDKKEEKKLNDGNKINIVVSYGSSTLINNKSTRASKGTTCLF